MTPTTARNAHHDKKQNPSYPTLLHVILLRSCSPSMVDAFLGGGADLDFAYVSSEDLPSIAATYLHLCNTTLRRRTARRADHPNWLGHAWCWEAIAAASDHLAVSP